ncbi:two-component regulator propeller domain-containing protein [Sapientia aquatica]|uniref:two-component regulator propeller domain-containing protein n=1 Tax=Sapientia aquatica TaxID=1549640 RepID=UPI00387331E6
MLQDMEGNIWIGTQRNGLLFWDSARGKFQYLRDDTRSLKNMSDDTVQSLFQDRTGTLWVGTWDKGAGYIDLAGGGFSSVMSSQNFGASLTNERIQTISGDAAGNIYAGTMGGLSVIDIQNNVTKSILVSGKSPTLDDRESVYFIVRKDPTSLWVASNQGILVFDTKQGKYVTKNKFASFSKYTNVFSLMVDHRQLLWIGTHNGLYRLDPKSDTTEAFLHDSSNPASIPDDAVEPLLEDSQHRIWIGADSGLEMFNPATNKFVIFKNSPNDKDSIGSGAITSLYEDSQKRLWIGSESGLSVAFVNQDNDIKFRFFPTESLVDCVLEGSDGNLWLSTDNEILKFDPNQFEFKKFMIQNSQPKAEFYFNSCYKDINGTMYFGGAQGMVYFKPGSVFGNSYSPNVVITDFQILNRSIRRKGNYQGVELDHAIQEVRHIQIPNDFNSFSIEFAALHFADPVANKYMYRLDGFDQGWISTNADRRFVTYTNLNPGVYTFRVKAANKNEVWSANETTLVIEIFPPFWKIWWVQWLMVIAAALSLFSFYRYQIGKVICQRDELERMVANRTQEIRQQNFNKSKFIADAVHDLKQPLQAITNFLAATRSAISNKNYPKSRELIDLAQDATQVMRTTFGSILELSRLESGLIEAECSVFNLKDIIEELVLSASATAEAKGVRLVVRQNPANSYFVDSDPVLLRRVIANLLSNAIKYSDVQKAHCPKVIIGLVARKDVCRIYVVDNGIGIPHSEQENIFKPFFQIHHEKPGFGDEMGMGLGLSIVNAIINLLPNHKLFFKSVVGAGTRFYVDVPRADEQDAPFGNLVNQSHITEIKTEVAGLFVLYVENDMLVRNSTEALFQAFGILCQAVGSIEELHAELPNILRRPDILLVNYYLPNGFTAYKAIDIIRSEFEHTIPTIVVTGNPKEVSLSAALGQTILLQKPVSAEVLINEIHRLTSVDDLGEL